MVVILIIEPGFNGLPPIGRAALRQRQELPTAGTRVTNMAQENNLFIRVPAKSTPRRRPAASEPDQPAKLAKS
jgi:hypothetical protein